MATANNNAKLTRAQAFATNWANSTLQALDGSTVIASFSINSFAASESNGEVICTSNVPTAVNTSGAGLVDTVKLIKGTSELTLKIRQEVFLDTYSFAASELVSCEAVKVKF